jgi:hypothetical protein
VRPCSRIVGEARAAAGKVMCSLQKLGSYTLAHGSEVLQNSVVALKGEWDVLLRQLGDFSVRGSGSGPALDIR